MSTRAWQTTDEYRGFYEFSNDGRVRSVRRLVNGVPRGGRELKVCKMESGLYCIRLKGLDGKLHFEIVTRLVAKAFVKNEYSNKARFVAYIDGSLSNEEGLNDAGNLAWVSFRAKTFETSKVPIVAHDLKNDVCKSFANVADAKEKLNLSSSADICRCLAGKQDKANGYSWTFSENEKKEVYVSSELKDI